ncbi:hypothetical protein Ae201684P_004830 [Aphanomyces euteiches]|nr:hypothetical protein Ae201684P_004830 [Aphanomyces euteiches]
MVQEVEDARTTIAALREQVAQDRDAMTHGREEAAKMLYRTGGGDVTADLAWPNTPADEVIARQQVALVAALRDRDEAREYLRERGNDVLQLRGELHESNTTQHALSEQVRAMRETAQGLQNVLAADGRRQDEEIRILRLNLQSARHDLRLKEVQSNERMLANEALKKKIQDARGPLIQPGLQEVLAELKESESKRQVLVKEAASSTAEIVKLKRMLKAVLNDLDDRARETAEAVEEARDSAAKLKKWQSVFEEVTALRDEVILKIEELRDRLVFAVRNGVLGDEGLRGAASSPEVPLPAIADVSLVDAEVTKWRAFADDLVARLRAQIVSDPELLAGLVPDASVGVEEAAGAETQTSFISPRSQQQASTLGSDDPNLAFTDDDFQLTGATDALGSQGLKRPIVTSPSKSKRSCKGAHLAALKSPRSASTGPARNKEVTPAIVRAYEAMMATKPWERYQHLPSIFPAERANEATRMVDEALKAFWLKRGREVFERMFYLKLDSATDKYGSLDQIAGPLEMVLASLKVAEEDCAGTQHLSPIAYFCSPRHQWPMLFKAPICLKTMFSTHGGDDQAERVVLAYLEESKQWFPRVPALARQQDKLLEWTCDPATTFKYYSQRSALKSKPHGDLAKYQVQTIDDLKVVCTQSISLVESKMVVPDQPYDFVDLEYSDLCDPGPQWGAFDVHTQSRLVRVDGGPVEPREAYEERLASAGGATII